MPDPDKGNIDFNSYIIPDDQLKPGQLRLLTVDNDLVVPAGKNIRVLATSADVIHSFFVPSLGVQRYAIPGRIIETWFRADKPGIYYGECNRISSVAPTTAGCRSSCARCRQQIRGLADAGGKQNSRTPVARQPPPRRPPVVG